MRSGRNPLGEIVAPAHPPPPNTYPAPEPTSRLLDSVNAQSRDRAHPASRVEHVYNELRANIVLGRHRPGSSLRLSELVTEYGVSLIPIREALRRLEVERLVENRPNRGARVASASVADVDDAYDTRFILESEALRRAWPNLDAPAVTNARSTLEKMFDAFAQGHLLEGAELHRSHHFELWKRSDSAWLDHLIQILWSHTERYRNLALVLHAPAPSDSEYHLLILDAIRRDDMPAAIRHTGEELAASKALVMGHLSKQLDADRAARTA